MLWPQRRLEWVDHTYYTLTISRNQFSQYALIGLSTNSHLFHICSEATGLVFPPARQANWWVPFWMKDWWAELERTFSCWRGGDQSNQRCSAANERGQGHYPGQPGECTEMGLNPVLLPAEAEETQQGKPEAALRFPFVSNCAPHHSQDRLLLLLQAVVFLTLICLIIELLIWTALC